MTPKKVAFYHLLHKSLKPTGRNNLICMHPTSKHWTAKSKSGQLLLQTQFHGCLGFIAIKQFVSIGQFSPNIYLWEEEKR